MGENDRLDLVGGGGDFLGVMLVLCLRSWKQSWQEKGRITYAHHRMNYMPGITPKGVHVGQF